MAKKKKRRQKGPLDGLRLFFDGVIVVCIFVTCIGGAVMEISTTELVWRCAYISLVLLLVSRIIIKVWVSWEQLKKSQREARRT